MSRRLPEEGRIVPETILQALKQEKVWDPVTRLWHWVLVMSVCVGWIFGEFMSFDTVEWHFYIGYLILGLLGFRILWGIVGPAPVRFVEFIPTPSVLFKSLKNFLKREPGGSRGHSPLGSLSVLAMLVVLAGQAFSGLFLEAEDFFEYGPLYDKVSDETVKFMSGWHYLLSDIILILVALHVCAILFYLIWKRENLIKPMISGWKWIKPDS